MKNKRLLILACLTLVIIVAASISTNKRAPQTVIEKISLAPELKSQINNVAQIIIESADGAVHIAKDDNEWVVMQADNYPARFDKVKKLVLDTADLYVLSEKTSNPALFNELGVEDITEEDSNSTLLTLLDSSGTSLTSIIVGNSRTQDSVYVRTAGSNNTYLVSGQPDVTTNPTDWIEKDLFNIANERIMEVVIEHPDGDILNLTRAQGKENFTLTTIPEGRKSRSEYFTNQPGTFLANVSILNAKSREVFSFPELPVKTIIATYDGLVATINSAKVEGQDHASLEFSVDESLYTSTQDMDDSTIVIGEEEPTALDIKQEVQALNDKVREWVFIIPQAKHLILSKTISELTDVIEEESAQ
ncbi:MAG: hypothetical protein ACI9XC_000361 [Gammaproteobacteria bacterium]|jgi:hypothetical protein